jgi:hypothetical protein
VTPQARLLEEKWLPFVDGVPEFQAIVLTLETEIKSP